MRDKHPRDPETGEFVSKSPARVSPKALAGGLGAAVASIIIFVLESVFGFDFPTAVDGAITTVVVFAVGFGAAHLKTDPDRNG